MFTPSQLDRGVSSPAFPLYDHAYDILLAKGYERQREHQHSYKCLGEFLKDKKLVSICIDEKDEFYIITDSPYRVESHSETEVILKDA